MNREQPVESGDLEYLTNVWPEVAQANAAGCRFDTLVESDEHTEGSAGKVLHVGKVQENLFRLVVEFPEFLPEFVDDALVRTPRAVDADDQDIALSLFVQESAL
jgi:hypothetical protein